jgi:hypothetical protein
MVVIIEKFNSIILNKNGIFLIIKPEIVNTKNAEMKRERQPI